MLGCPKCRWLKNGCGACRERPMLARPRQRWQPENGRYQHVSKLSCRVLCWWINTQRSWS